MIADLHLRGSQEEMTSFLSFLNRLPEDLKNLVILGDFFDAWIGPELVARDAFPLLPPALKKISDKGVDVYLVRGNRDVLLRPKDGQIFSATVVDRLIWGVSEGPENTGRVLLSHGDEYCLHDRPYQRLRSFLRCSILRGFLFALPACARLFLGLRIRSASQQSVARKSLDVLALDELAVTRALGKFEADEAWIGHLHSEEVRDLGGATSSFSSQKSWKLRILPAWGPNVSAKELSL